MTTTAPDLTGLRTWISGTVDAEAIALLRDLGALPLTGADILAEHPHDRVESLKACAETLLGADALVYVGAPDPVEALLAQAAGLKVLELSCARSY